MEAVKVDLERMIPKTMIVPIEGITPLICGRCSEEKLQEIEDERGGKAKKMRQKPNPKRDYERSLYKHPDGGYGFPAIGFKLGMVRAAKGVPGFDMVTMRGAIHAVEELVKIKGKPEMRKDRAPSGGKLDIRYRGMFKKWEVNLTLKYIEGMITPEQILALVEKAGTQCGVGEWRPTGKNSTGHYGMYQVRVSK